MGKQDVDRPRSKAQQKRIQAERELSRKLRLEAKQVSAELAIMELRSAVMLRELELKQKVVDDLRTQVMDARAARRNRLI